MNKNKIGMMFFIGSEAFFFIALIIAYAYYSHPGGKLSETARYLDIKRTFIFSLFLFASSLSIEFAKTRFRLKNRKRVVIWLLITIVLGIVFLLGQGTEYLRLVQEKVTISKDVFGSSFFTLTGFHGLHVLAGLILLSIITGMIGTGKFKNMETGSFNSVSMYWHFVDAVWVVVFITVYIGALI